jgi:hypothetical protein
MCRWLRQLHHAPNEVATNPVASEATKIWQLQVDGGCDAVTGEGQLGEMTTAGQPVVIAGHNSGALRNGQRARPYRLWTAWFRVPVVCLRSGVGGSGGAGEGFVLGVRLLVFRFRPVLLPV